MWINLLCGIAGFLFTLFILNFFSNFFKGIGLTPKEKNQIQKDWANWLKNNPEPPSIRSTNRRG